jgi:hypothetical protein
MGCIAVSPTGRLHFQPDACDQQVGQAARARIAGAFARGDSHGLIHLGLVEVTTTLPAELAYFREHVAAALYGVGARLDREPDIFFTLRQVDQTQLLSEATAARGVQKKARGGRGKALPPASLSAIFGIEIED